MQNLHLLLFFFVLLAPLQQTKANECSEALASGESSGCKTCCEGCLSWSTCTKFCSKWCINSSACNLVGKGKWFGLYGNWRNLNRPSKCYVFDMWCSNKSFLSLYVIHCIWAICWNFEFPTLSFPGLTEYFDEQGAADCVIQILFRKLFIRRRRSFRLDQYVLPTFLILYAGVCHQTMLSNRTLLMQGGGLQINFGQAEL